MSSDRIVVIGGDAAGMSAAAKIRREKPEQEILVLERTRHTSYSACGMPYYIGGLVDDVDKLIARAPHIFRQKYHIDVRTNHEVVEIDTKSSRVRACKNGGDEIEFSFDQLLIATGASPFCPDVPGKDAKGIFGLGTLASGIRVQEYITVEKPRKAVVIGGGYIGLEMAEAMVRRGLDVSLVQNSPEVMDTLDLDMGALVSKALCDIGVHLYRSESFEAFDTVDGKVKAVLTDRRTLPADIVILGMGVRPNSSLAASAGIELDVKEAIRVNERMQTSMPNIWAAGDCVASLHRLTGRLVHIALGTIANKQGLVAGINLAGGQATFPGVVGTAVSKICKVEVASTGLQAKELDELGCPYATARIETKTRAGYYPGAGPITVKLLGERQSGRLLGGQIVGMEGAAKRIDILATALTAGMTVAELIDLDLSYAPPFSPVWDPVQIAARRLVKEL